ncbi:MAG: hypothetical protein EAZ44_09690 [Cytophagia bacterium]|nr:MAG: hypothetical protein EAZ44_09690 [Cytophagia bacterium]TAG40654.1 MAG: hypothetical protein EAZ31_08230 [Cytophagia bacterium]
MQKNIFFFLLFSVFIVSCQSPQSRIKKGEMNIIFDDFYKNNALELYGEWEFYWKELLTPNDFRINQIATNVNFIKVPSSWTAYKDKKNQNYTSYGYATYRLKINIDDFHYRKEGAKLGLFIPKIWSASKIWVNDELVLERGKIGMSFQDYKNQMAEKIVLIQPAFQQIEIIVQVANYDIFVAGLIQSFKIGEYEKLITNRQLSNGSDLMWLGCLFLMAFYHFILYFFRPKNSSTLYFGFACLIIASRIIVFGDHYFYQYLKETDLLNFEWQSKIYYIASFLLIPIALLYIHSLYPKQSNKKIILLPILILGTYCFFILTTSPRIFSPTINIFEIISLISELYLVGIVIFATIRKEKDAIFQTIGIVFMSFASINDVFHGEELELVGTIELTPIAFVFFLLLQIFIIARRFSQAFNEVEDLSENLEKKVVIRTLELQEANKEIEAQKDAIEEKNKHITDSIAYAQRIQQAILPLPDNMLQFIPDFFILFKPKDIVSGDFYYFEEVENKIIIAAVDCTGHGIPGALMSMLAKEILDNITLEKKIIEADKILNELHKGIRMVLKQNEGTNRDGMDLSLLVIDKNNNEIEFAGAKNSLLYIQDNQLKEIKADRNSIGGEQKEEERLFTKHIIKTDKNTMFYLFSDGYQDQFGGENRRKFMIAQFKKILLENHQKDIKIQKEILSDTIEKWIEKGYEKQTDDILVWGLKL